jgi:hypothetical protein
MAPMYASPQTKSGVLIGNSRMSFVSAAAVLGQPMTVPSRAYFVQPPWDQQLLYPVVQSNSYGGHSLQYVYGGFSLQVSALGSLGAVQAPHSDASTWNSSGTASPRVQSLGAGSSCTSASRPSAASFMAGYVPDKSGHRAGGII